MEEVNGNVGAGTVIATSFERTAQELPKTEDRGREVVYAQLHSVVFLPGPTLGNLKDVLGEKVYSGMKCWFNERGLEVSYKGFEFVVPAANVKIAQYRK